MLMGFSITIITNHPAIDGIYIPGFRINISRHLGAQSVLSETSSSAMSQSKEPRIQELQQVAILYQLVI